MMAAASVSRAFRLFSPSLRLSHGFINQTANRDYSRGGLRRQPVKTFTSEEAEKLSKPSLLYQEETPAGAPPQQASTPSHKKKRADQVPSEPREERFRDDAGERKTSAKSFQEKPKTKRDFYEEPKLEPMTVAAGGQTLQLNVMKDKFVAERKLSTLMQIVKTAKARKANGKILLEGERLMADAMKAGLHTDAIFFSSPELLGRLPLGMHPEAQLYQVHQSAIQLWSELTTSPGIAGFFDITKAQDLESVQESEKIPLTLICDNVRDPGNMGSILRSAAAIGCRRLITTPECVDIWDSKVLRSAAGAHFRLKTTLNVDWEVMAGNYVPEDTTVLLADSDGSRKRQETALKSSSTRFGDQELAQELLKAEGRSTNRKSVDLLEDGSMIHRDASYADKNLLRLYRRMPLPSLPYTDLQLDSSANSVVLVIGGETHGLSHAAYKLAHDLGGAKVFIPLENQVESLNAGVAFGILGYEIRRQLIVKSSSASLISNNVSQ